MIQRRTVGIVGTGNVGTAAAYALFNQGLASELLLLDKDARRAEGEAMDLMHGQLLAGRVTCRAVDYPEMSNAQVIILAAGASQKSPDETRLELLERNARIFREIVTQLDKHAPEAILVVATNPVDVLTYLSQEMSRRPHRRIVGTGTLLDTARFRALLGRHYGVDPRSVHAYILGEHGDSEVPIWSNVRIGGVPLRRYCPACDKHCPTGELDDIFYRVKNAAYEIIRGKGSTYYAIGLALVDIAASILRNENNILTVSTLVDGFYDIRDVCLSIPVLVNTNGVAKTVNIHLEPSEADELRASANALKGIIRDLAIS